MTCNDFFNLLKEWVSCSLPPDMEVGMEEGLIESEFENTCYFLNSRNGLYFKSDFVNNYSYFNPDIVESYYYFRYDPRCSYTCYKYHKDYYNARFTKK